MHQRQTTKSGHLLICCLSVCSCQDPNKVYQAYNDRDNVTHNFSMNGLQHANRLLGYEAFKTSDWEAVGEYDQPSSRHRAFVVPKADVTVEGVDIRRGEKVRIEESYKWPVSAAKKLWKQAGAKSGVIQSAFFSNKEGSYGKSLAMMHAYYSFTHLESSIYDVTNAIKEACCIDSLQRFTYSVDSKCIIQ